MKPQNVLVIMSDEHSARMMGCVGHKLAKTPNLDAAGSRDTTYILYTSDHGENAGARGLWGKSNDCEEAVRIPPIVAGKATTKSVVAR